MNISPVFSGAYHVDIATTTPEKHRHFKRLFLSRVAFHYHLKAQEAGNEEIPNQQVMELTTMDGQEFFWLVDDKLGNHATKYDAFEKQAFDEVEHEMKAMDLRTKDIDEVDRIEENLMNQKMYSLRRQLKTLADEQRKKISFFLFNPNEKNVDELDFLRTEYTVPKRR